MFFFVLFFLSLYCRLRPEAEVSAHVEGSLSAEVTSIVLDALEQLVQVSVLCVFKGEKKYTLKFEENLKILVSLKK